MSNLLFLEDYQETFQYQLTEADESKKGFFIRGIVSRANVPNKNKRIYPISVMEEAVNQVKDIAHQGGFVGELDHPPFPKINVDKISHKITEISMSNDGAVLAEMTVLNTEKGRELKELILGGVKLGVSTRGLGGVKPYSGSLGEGYVEVQPGFKMKAIDIVFDPSAGDDGRPEFVNESVTENGIILGHSRKFEQVWNDIFGGK
ncbi:MAG: primosomal protein [bacterium]